MPVDHIFEISFDPLSDTTPTWTDLSSRLLAVPSIQLGVSDDLADPAPGTATFRVDVRDRALEPGYAASPYYPNVRPLRRVRYRIDDGTTVHPIFYGYIVDWGPTWPDRLINQEAEIRAVDGSMILERDALALLDPPDATTYEEVVMFDGPFGYWPLRDLGGAAKAAAVVGPEGTYTARQLLVLGGSGPIVGDRESRSVHFDESGTVEGHVKVPLSSNEWLADGDAVTVEVWVKPDVDTLTIPITGPENTSALSNIFWIEIQNGAVRFMVMSLASLALSAALSANLLVTTGSWNHVVCVAVSGQMRVYVNGVLVASASYQPPLLLPTLNSPFFIGADPVGNDGFTGSLAEVAVYEHALSADRILAHYNAGVSGFAAQMAGERIESVVTSALWAETEIATGHHEVQPAMEHGQSRLEEVYAAVRAEMPHSIFDFPGTADPRYLGWEYRADPPYNEPQAIFGNGSGEVPFADVALVYDDDLYNDVTVSREGGVAQTATDEDSIGEFYRRAYTVTGLTHTEDAGCMMVAGAILSEHSQPQERFASITLTSEDEDALEQILTRLPGDCIRVKHRPQGGTAIDIITWIIGRALSVSDGESGGVITCTWNLARGFDAAAGYWRAGIVGFSEAGTTTVAA